MNSELVENYLYCALYSVIFVGFLYIWPSNYPRDHPVTLKRRFTTVSVACVLILIIVGSHALQVSLLVPYNWYEIVYYYPWQAIFIRVDHLFNALIYPLLLTMVVFLGPIMFEVLTYYKSRSRIFLRHENVFSLLNVRNLFMAPVTEELVFRACVLHHLLRVHNCLFAILVGPLFFGLCHFHHLTEKIRSGQSVGRAVMDQVFQVAYTSVFGVYAGVVLLRSGHLLSAVVVHMFCNFMGFPDLDFSGHSRAMRILLMGAHVLGVVLFSVYFWPWTEPALFGNSLYICRWSF